VINLLTGVAAVPRWVPQNVWSILTEVTLGLTGTSSATTIGAALSLMSLSGKIGMFLLCCLSLSVFLYFVLWPEPTEIDPIYGPLMHQYIYI